MSNAGSEDSNSPSAASAVKKTSKDRGFSPIWIVPIVAVLIGAFLIYKVISESGPTITVSWKEGTGLEAGKTQVKYKDVVVGSVTSIDLEKDISSVNVTIEMDPSAAKYMTDKTRFWVVRPRISAGSISGLSTLLSGAYIGLDPVQEGKTVSSFVGLERPPVVQSDDPGTTYTLKSRKLGGLDFGTPIYFRQLTVGQVINYELKDDGTISLDVFVKKPYDKFVNEATRFWNASGVDVKLSVDGLEVNTESLVALIGGGIAFDTVKGLGADASKPVGAKQVFRLYATQDDSRKRKYTEKIQWLMYFDDPIRGLRPGAPVELRGYKIGEVVDIEFVFDQQSAEFKIPVLVEVEPERIRITGEDIGDRASRLLVDRGLRAQLQTGNLVLGQLLIDLDFYPDAPPADIDYSGSVPVFPTIKGTLGVLLDDARAVLAELRQVGETINELLASQEFTNATADVAATLAHVNSISAQLDAEAAPEIADVLKQVAGTLSEAQEMFAAESTTRNEVNRLLIELADAARSIRQLADYLEQNPESLIRGKD